MEKPRTLLVFTTPTLGLNLNTDRRSLRYSGVVASMFSSHLQNSRVFFFACSRRVSRVSSPIILNQHALLAPGPGYLVPRVPWHRLQDPYDPV